MSFTTGDTMSYKQNKRFNDKIRMLAADQAFKIFNRDEMENLLFYVAALTAMHQYEPVPDDFPGLDEWEFWTFPEEPPGSKNTNS